MEKFCHSYVLKCEECGKQWRRVYDLVRHFLHTHKRDLHEKACCLSRLCSTCIVCNDAGFGNPSELQRHMLMHPATTEEAYQKLLDEYIAQSRQGTPKNQSLAGFRIGGDQPARSGLAAVGARSALLYGPVNSCDQQQPVPRQEVFMLKKKSTNRTTEIVKI
jgi:hypothetical protein